MRQVYHRLSHSLQFSLQRRFANGFSAGLNWNWVLMDEGNYQTNFRFEHVNGQLQLRADQAKYDELNKNMGTPVHFFKGNFVWDLPDLHAGSGVGHDGGPEHHQRLAALRCLDRRRPAAATRSATATRATAAA